MTRTKYQYDKTALKLYRSPDAEDLAISRSQFGWKRSGGQFVPVVEQIEVIREAWEWHEMGQSYVDIADMLNEEGRKTARGNDWSKETVRQLIDAVYKRPLALRLVEGTITEDEARSLRKQTIIDQEKGTVEETFGGVDETIQEEAVAGAVAMLAQDQQKRLEHARRKTEGRVMVGMVESELREIGPAIMNGDVAQAIHGNLEDRHKALVDSIKGIPKGLCTHQKQAMSRLANVLIAENAALIKENAALRMKVKELAQDDQADYEAIGAEMDARRELFKAWGRSDLI